MTIPRVPSSVILLPFLRKDLQQRQIALCPTMERSKKHAMPLRVFKCLPCFRIMAPFLYFYKKAKRMFIYKIVLLYGSNDTMRWRMLGQRYSVTSILGSAEQWRSEEHSCRILRFFRHRCRSWRNFSVWAPLAYPALCSRTIEDSHASQRST